MTHLAAPLPSTPVRTDALPVEGAGPGIRLSFTEEEFCDWLAAATPGRRIEYHRGFLAIDRMPSTTPMPHGQRKQLVAIAKRALQAAEEGKLHLVQKRHGDGDYSYFAIKARRQPRGATAPNGSSARGGR